MATPISGLLERVRNGLSRFWCTARKGLYSGLGEVRWTPPPWVRGMRVRVMNGRALVQRYPKHSGLMASLAALVALGGYAGWRWYQNLPKPVEYEVSVTNP